GVRPNQPSQSYLTEHRPRLAHRVDIERSTTLLDTISKVTQNARCTGDPLGNLRIDRRRAESRHIENSKPRGCRDLERVTCERQRQRIPRVIVVDCLHDENDVGDGPSHRTDRLEVQKDGWKSMTPRTAAGGGFTS